MLTYPPSFRAQLLEKEKAMGPIRAIGSSTALKAVPFSSQSVKLNSATGLATVAKTHKNISVRTTFAGATIIPSMGIIMATIRSSSIRLVVTLASASVVLVVHLSLTL